MVVPFASMVSHLDRSFLCQAHWQVLNASRQVEPSRPATEGGSQDNDGNDDNDRCCELLIVKYQYKKKVKVQCPSAEGP